MKKLLASVLFLILLATLALTRTRLMDEFRPSKNPLWKGFVAGQKYRYDVSMESHSTFDMGRMLLPTQSDKKSLLPPNQLRIQIRDAVLAVNVLRAREAGLELTLALETLVLAVESPLLNPSGTRSLEEELKLPLSLAVGPDAKIAAFYFNPSHSVLAQNILRSMILQLFPRRSSGEVWEDSAQGQSLALYESTRPGIITKEFRDHRIKGSQIQPTIDGGFTYAFHAEDDTLNRVEGRRGIRAQQAGQLHFDDQLTLTATLLESKPSDVSWLSALGLRMKGQKAFSDAREQLERLEYELNVKAIGGQSFSNLEVELRSDASKLRAADQVEMYRKLKAHLALDSGLVDDFKQLIEEFGSSDPRFDMLVTILATNGSESAQEALADLMEDFWEDPHGLHNLGIHLALVDKPSERTVEFFAESLQNLEPDSASYELMLQLSGSVIYTSSHPDMDGRIYSQLVAQFEQPQRTNLYQAAVTGLANSGHPDNWNRASSLLQQGDPHMRNNGLSMLRLVQGPYSAEVEQVYLSAVQADAAPNNRRDAAAYLSQRKVSSEALPVLAAAFSKEKDQSVSINILDAIAHRPEDPKKAVETLKELNSQCGSPETCAKAEALLLSLLSL